MTSDELQTKIISKVKDDSSKLTPDDYANAGAEALKRYSKHRPRLVVADLPGTGSHDLALPSDWSEGISSIASVEYPVGNVPESLLDNRDWKLYRSPAALNLRLMQTPITAAETVRILYSVMHTEATVPDADEEAIANLAASFCLRQLAAVYGQTGDSTLSADVVNYRSKADEFRRLADSFEKLYREHLGLKDNDTTTAAMVTSDPADDNRVRLTHYRGETIYPIRGR
jgi:hypothetical protein